MKGSVIAIGSSRGTIGKNINNLFVPTKKMTLTCRRLPHSFRAAVRFLTRQFHDTRWNGATTQGVITASRTIAATGPGRLMPLRTGPRLFPEDSSNSAVPAKREQRASGKLLAS
jgi:hypothetical protein